MSDIHIRCTTEEKARIETAAAEAGFRTKRGGNITAFLFSLVDDHIKAKADGNKKEWFQTPITTPI